MPGNGGERLEVGELEVHGIKKYLMKTIITIDFSDTCPGAIMTTMDINLYALEIVARDRLDRARARAAAHRLLTSDGARALRRTLRVSLGLALIALGRRLRGAGSGALEGLTRA